MRTQLEVEKQILDALEAGLRVLRPMLAQTHPSESELTTTIRQLADARRIQYETVDKLASYEYHREKHRDLERFATDTEGEPYEY